MPITPTVEQAADIAAIGDLLFDHWERIDRVTEELIHELYTADGEMRIGALERTGRDDLLAYATERRASEDETSRRTRHAMTNLRVRFDGRGTAEVRFLMTVYAGRGAMPYPSTPPSTLADFAATCRRREDGEWLIASLRGSPVFIGSEAPSNLR